MAPLSGLSDPRLQRRLTQRFLAAELQAEKKSRGVWSEERGPTRLGVAKTQLARAGVSMASGVTVLGKVAMLPVRAIKNLQGLWRRTRGKNS